MTSITVAAQNINVVQSKAELGSGIHYGIEGVRRIGDHLIINGWVIDPFQKISSVAVRFSKHGKPVDLKPKFLCFARKEFPVAFSAAQATIDTHYGFVALCEDSQIRHVETLGIAVVAVGGNVFADSYRVNEVRDPVRAMPELISLVPGEQVRVDVCERFFEPLATLMARYSNRSDELVDMVYGPAQEVVELSVIIPLHGSIRFENVQIPALAALHRPDWEILLAVDDPSIVDAVRRNARRLSSLYGVSVRVVAPDRNLGFAGINNFAVARARGQRLLFLNSDCFIGSVAAIEKAANWLDRTDAAGAVGFRLMYPDRTIQHDGMAVGIWNDDPQFMLNKHPRIGLPLALASPPSNGDANLLTAACLMTTRECFELVGGFDRVYYRGDFEDSDFCLKLVDRKLRLAIVRDEGIFHLERQTISTQESGLRQKITLINSYIYTRKWRHLLDSRLPALEVIQ